MTKTIIKQVTAEEWEMIKEEEIDIIERLKWVVYSPKDFSSPYTRKTGQTIAFRNPKTPIQKPVAVDMKYITAPKKPNP